MTHPVAAADVYVGEALAGNFTRLPDGFTEFRYVDTA